MSDNKNIDRLFQEKFKDFEVAPNAAVWERISESLPNQPKKKRRVIALWWQIGGIAAALALLFTVGFTVFSTDENLNSNAPVVNSNTTEEDNTATGLRKAPETNIADTNKDAQTKKESTKTETNTISKALITPNKQEENTVVNNAVIKKSKTLQKRSTTNSTIKNERTSKVAAIQSEEKRKTTLKTNTVTNLPEDNSATKIAANTNEKKTDSDSSNKTTIASESHMKSAIQNMLDNKTTIANNSSNINSAAENTSNKESSQNTKNSNIEDTTKATSTKESLIEAIAKNTDKPIIEKEEDKQNRWSIAPNVAPVYFSSLGQGSSIDQQFNENAKSSDVNMSYGITGTYAVSKKLRIRAGINRVDLSQTTSDVFAFTGAETASRGIDAQFSNISFSNGVQTVSLMSSKMLDRSSAPELFNTKIAGNVDQRFGFIEVPLELEYRLVDKKFGVNVIGGFSTFFLNENELYADIDGVSTLIGDANNVNGTSFSANFGLGLDYSLSKQWNINLEPTFKYQINTFNNTSGDFRPFFIGVYTGLSFKF